MSQRVLSFHYNLTDDQGKQLESSRGSQPVTFLEGTNMILSALEKELFQMSVGDTKKVALKADEAYGQIDEKWKAKVHRSKLPQGQLAVGVRLQTGPEQGGRVFTVTRIEGDDVYLDGNHPLAGLDLNFDVEIIAIRAATEEELAKASQKKDCCSDPDCDE